MLFRDHNSAERAWCPPKADERGRILEVRMPAGASDSRVKKQYYSPA